MSDQPETQAETQPEQTIGLRNIYLKDASFEAPNSPYIFHETTQPEFDLSIATNYQNLEQDFYEIVIIVTVTAKHNDKTAFLIEVQQAGVFELQGFDEKTLEMVIGVFCPTQLFPYAREAVSTLIGKGGFPPLLLEPINFEELYAQQYESEQENKIQH